MAQFSDYAALSHQGLSEFRQAASELGRIRQASIEFAAQGFGTGQEIGLRQQKMKLDAAQVVADAKMKNAQFGLNVATAKETAAQGRQGLRIDFGRLKNEERRVGIEEEDAKDQRWYRREDLRIKEDELKESRLQTAAQRDAAAFEREQARIATVNGLHDRYVQRLIDSGTPADFAYSEASRLITQSGGDGGRLSALMGENLDASLRKGRAMGAAASHVGNIAISDIGYLRNPVAMRREVGQQLGYDMRNWKNLPPEAQEEINITARHSLVVAGEMARQRATAYTDLDFNAINLSLQDPTRGGIVDPRVQDVISLGETMDALVRTGEIALDPDLREFSKRAATVKSMYDAYERQRTTRFGVDKPANNPLYGRHGG